MVSFSDFLLIPAIDLMDGQCVGLPRERDGRKSVYSDNPPEMARSFEMSGAKRLHVVDLDGAFQGKPVNLESIRAIRERVSCEIQVGGGLRTRESLKEIFAIGVDYAILSTKAVEEPAFIESILADYGDKIVLAVDAIDGKLATKGRVEVHDRDILEWAREIDLAGVKTVIYTDISFDGPITGLNIEAHRRMAEAVGMSVIASGGVASVADVLDLASLPCSNLIGAVAGKSICDGRLDLIEALKELAARS